MQKKEKTDTQYFQDNSTLKAEKGKLNKILTAFIKSRTDITKS